MSISQIKEPDTALIIHAALKNHGAGRDVDESIAEIEGLARAIHLNVLATQRFNLSRVVPATYLGKGMVEGLAALCEELEPTIVIFNGTLTPGQQRNLEKALNVKVIDRTGLILEIFGERAQTREGVLQVDLAMLDYQKSRLVRSWTHLERQRGGGGFMGGPGETQIELDRRIITDKIAALKKELEQVKKTRSLGRKSREKVPFPIVALVGYTNAGKSTLFNRLTGAEVMAEDLLFATLDPTLRSLELPNGQQIILSDTVGFISELPTTLIAAFRATLEEVTEADVILHIRDVAHDSTDHHRQDVIDVLKELGIDHHSDERIIEVLNKLDACAPETADEYRRQAATAPDICAISALSGEGIEGLLERIAEKLAKTHIEVTYRLSATDGQAQSWLHRHGDILDTQYEDTDVLLTVRLSEADIGKFKSHFGYAA